MHKGMIGRQGEEGPGSVSPLGTTLNDYIQKALVQETSPKKKLSFEEWLSSRGWSDAARVQVLEFSKSSLESRTGK